MPTLTITLDGGDPKVLTFTGEVVVGRGVAADLTIPDPSISRRHARFTVQGARYFVQDLKSANGTRVNGTTADVARPVGPGDLLELGFVRAVFGDESATGFIKAQEVPAVGYRDDGQAPQVLYSLPAAQHEVNASTGTGPQVSLQKYLKFIEGLASVSEMVFDTQAVIQFASEQLLVLMPAADRAFVMLAKDGSNDLYPAAVKTRKGQSGEIVASRTLLREVVERRAAVLVVDTLGDARFTGAESIHTMGIRSAITAPIMFQGELHGVLQIDTIAGVPFDNPDVALVLALASQVGLALATARLHEAALKRGQLDQDMQLATRLQAQFLPTEPPQVRGYGFTFINEPALGIGGDFCDFIDLGEGRLALVVGDVSGKGVSAALYAAKLTSDIRYQTVGQTHPAAILGRVNNAVSHRDREGMFATAVIAVLNQASGQLEVANAGHLAPIVCEANGRVFPLGQTKTIPLGLDRDATFVSQTYTMEPGTTVFFYTDGVTEALNRQQHVFGDDRLLDACRASKGTSAERLNRLRSAVSTFVVDEAPSDDLTIVCVQRTS